MANMNTVAGFQSFSQSVSVNTEVGCLITAAGGYPGYPSPAFVIGTPMTASIPPDIAGGELDGHPFKILLSGTATTAGSYTFRFGVYQTSAANLGVIGTAGQVTTAGAHGTGSTITLALSTATTISTTTANFYMEMSCIWDSTSKLFTCSTQTGAFQAGVALAAPAITSAGAGTVTISSVGLTDLNFWPAFTFGTAGANSMVVKEFSINRM